MYKRINELLGTGYKSDKDIDWNNITVKFRLSEDFIEEFSDKLDWSSVSMYQALSESFIERHKDQVDWVNISVFQALSEDFIERNKDLVNWSSISIDQSLSEEFIEKYKDQVDWLGVSMSNLLNLSEEFIERNKDLLHWNHISATQFLSESFILDHKDLVNWANISAFQLLSPEFIRDYKDKLDIDMLLRRQPFIESNNPINLGSKLYQETKDRGWFIGYLDSNERNKKYFYYSYENCSMIDNGLDTMISPNYVVKLKVRIYWKDLVMVDRTKKYEPIRLLKYV